MKMSAMMFMPRNIQMSQSKYIIARAGLDIVVIPGSRIQLGKTETVLEMAFKIMRVIKYLPVAEFLEVCILDNLTALKPFDLHMLVYFTREPVISSNNCRLHGQDAAKDCQDPVV